MEIPFVGGAYTGKSVNQNTQECINLFPVVDNRGGKNQIYLYGTPGISQFSTIVTEDEDTVNRGSWVLGNRLYTIVKNTVYSVNTFGDKTSIGTISTSSGNVFFADNGAEIIIVDGTSNGYIISGGVLTAITDSDFPIATSVTFQDGYFIITSDSGKFYISGLYDGFTWDSLDFASAESSPDAAVLVIANADDLWILGTGSAEVYYNSGNVDFPYTRISGAILEIGTASAASVINIDGIIYWLSNKGRVVRSRGYQFDTVSTIQIDYQISTYSTIDDAKAFTYELQGHIFYVLIFPAEEKTWVYDVTTDFWHEWQSYSSVDIEIPWGRHRANSCVKFNGDYIVGDYINGLLYKLDEDVYTDNLNYIRRRRTSQVVNKERYNIIWHRLEIDFETGVGLDGGVQGEDPQVMLEWSKDGGHTWSNEYWKSFGKIGKYSTKVVWKRLGMSRNRVLRVTISDPVKVVMLGAYAELEECSA